MKSYLISSTKKSSGKTIIATGLCSILSNIDSLAAFKKGPDYIDPLWLSQASKAKCYNLDFFTMKYIQNIEYNTFICAGYMCSHCIVFTEI